MLLYGKYGFLYEMHTRLPFLPILRLAKSASNCNYNFHTINRQPFQGWIQDEGKEGAGDAAFVLHNFPINNFLFYKHGPREGASESLVVVAVSQLQLVIS